MKKLFVGAMITTLALGVACTKKPGSMSADQLKSDEDKVFYTVGTMLGQRFKNLEPSDAELAALYAGLADSAKGNQPVIDTAQYQQKVQELFQGRATKAAEKVKKEGDAYLENFVKGGGTKTESGLAYKILTPGSGKKPKAEDTVEVHYHGTLINGEVFDSSKDRGKTVEFPLNRVIRGWTEGVQLIGEGGKVQLVIPAALAYGDSGAPPKIPGGATLVFEVELFKVKDAAPPAPAPAAPKKGKK